MSSSVRCHKKKRRGCSRDWERSPSGLKKVSGKELALNPAAWGRRIGLQQPFGLNYGLEAPDGEGICLGKKKKDAGANQRRKGKREEPTEGRKTTT